MYTSLSRVLSHKQLLKFLFILCWGLISILLARSLSTDTLVQYGLGVLLFMAGLWMTEVIPLAVSALCVPILAWAFNLMDATQALSYFSHPIIFLFMGGFALAAMLSQHGIDRWLASLVLIVSKGRLGLAVILFFMVTAVLSAWMSNTSATAMMLPIALAIVSDEYPRMRLFAVLGTAYAANIGGIATIVGSPPNAIAAAALDLDFITWLKIGLPVTILLFPVMIAVLWFVCRPESTQRQNFKQGYVMEWTLPAKTTVVIFIVTVFLWICSKPISSLLGVSKLDSMVALAVVVVGPSLGILNWEQLQRKIDWGILLLFGGGLCLSGLLSITGASSFIAHFLMDDLASYPSWVILLAAVTLMVFLTEFASNTGSAAILIPILLSVAEKIDPALVLPMVLGVGCAATCAFMLPVATPPNALAYGTGLVPQKTMLKAGMILNICAIPLVTWLAFNLFVE